MYRRSAQGWLKHIDFILWDAAVIQLAYVLAYLCRHGIGLPYVSQSYRILAIMFAVIDVLVAAMFNTMHNVLKRGYLEEFLQTSKQVIAVLVSMTLYLFAVHSGSDYSRTAIFLTAGFHLLLGYLVRCGWKQVIRLSSKAIDRPTMLLVADEKQIAPILGHMNATEVNLFTGLILTNRDGEGEIIRGIPVVANLPDAADYICREWVDEIFVYRSESATPLIEQCKQMAIPVHIRLPISSLGGKSFVEKVAGFNVVTTTSNYVSPLEAAAKRIMDIAGGIVGSIIALLIMAIVGPVIKKKSPGPILFKQTRIGQNGKKFQIYKIRSMYLDAEERKKELLEKNRVQDGMMFKMDFDPRIIGNEILPDGTKRTGIGEFIRSHSLDEFPQFFNVLFGEMSLVGTRPPTVDEWEKYEYHHRARLATKPGITGMWQVSGRSNITDFEEVVRLDTEYINNWSLALDIKILFKTLKVVFGRDGAM